jgi:hypothetical protein
MPALPFSVLSAFQVPLGSPPRCINLPA